MIDEQLSLAIGDGEGNGTPLQYSCLENPMDRGAWQAAVYRVAQCRTRLSNFTLTFHFSLFLHWRRKWQPTPVFLPGESQGRGSLVGCRLWGHTESDMTEAPQQQQQQQLEIHIPNRYHFMSNCAQFCYHKFIQLQQMNLPGPCLISALGLLQQHI